MITHISFESKSIESDVIDIQSRSMSDPTFSDIDCKWLSPELSLNQRVESYLLQQSKMLNKP